MKFLITSDWHLRSQRPRNRKDQNYVGLQSLKVTKISKIFHRSKCDYVLHGGDMFGNVDVSHYLTQHYIKLLSKLGMPILVVPGQHDMRFHSTNIRNTPLAVLNAAGVIEILDEDPVKLARIHIYGQWWGKEVPKIKHEHAVNILVAHRMVTEIKPNYETDFVIGRKFLEQNNFNLIATGDNHETFSYHGEKGVLANPGSLVRTNIDQVNHKPCVFTYDTETKKLEQEFIKVEPIAIVMSIIKAEREKNLTSELERFSDELVSDKSFNDRQGLNFRKNLDLAIRKVDLDVGKFISTIVREIDNDKRR